MNPQTERHNIDLSDETKFIPMVLCPEQEGTCRIEDRWYRKARKGENPSLHKQRDHADE